MLLERVDDRGLWQSLRQMESLQQKLNQMLYTGQTNNSRDYQFPPINVWVSEHQAAIEAEIPGIEPNDIDISVIGDTLVLKGSRKKVDLKEGETYHRQERGYGDFARTIELPFKIEAEKVEAEFRRGILVVKLPRAEVDKPKKITVKSLA
jgi:HSP20 family protein